MLKYAAMIQSPEFRDRVGDLSPEDHDISLVATQLFNGEAVDYAVVVGTALNHILFTSLNLKSEYRRKWAKNMGKNPNRDQDYVKDDAAGLATSLLKELSDLKSTYEGLTKIVVSCKAYNDWIPLVSYAQSKRREANNDFCDSATADNLKAEALFWDTVAAAAFVFGSDYKILKTAGN